MTIPAMTNGPASEALHLSVSRDIHNDLYQGLTVRYSNTLADNILHDITTVPANCLDTEQIFESWAGVDADNSSLMQCRVFHNQQYLLASLPITPPQHLNIEQASEQAYSLIFQLMAEWDYPFLLRTWNYFPAITDYEGSQQNNYQLFCSGRARAYAQHDLAAQAYPAATVIGTADGGLSIYFIAAKSAGIGIENSKQVSAFEYPSAYSEDPPLFSRALLHTNSQQQFLFISGTASITGHNTQYADDVNSQIKVCLENIEHLITTANMEHNFACKALADLSHLKVFIKHADDFATIKTHLQHYLGLDAPAIYLQGDMCRSDLLVEIEALASCPNI